MAVSDSISGSRPGTERKAPKVYSLASLMSKPGEAADLAALYKGVAEKGANCEEDPDKWTGDDLPTAREAQAMCAGCECLNLCRTYAENNKPSHGVWAGKVYDEMGEEAE